MFDERDRKYFYDEFKNNGYEVGSYDDFKNDLNNKEDRDWYYNEAKNMGYDVGTQSDFDKMVMEPAASASSDSKQVAASAEGKQQVAQPVAKPAAEKPKEDNRSWLTKWMTGTLPEDEKQETADKEPGLIAKALNMFPTGVQTSNGTYQPAPAIPQPTVKGEEMPVEVEATPSSANVASPESKEEVPASAAVVNNDGLMDAKLANYIENWKLRPDKEGDYFENMVADLLADGTANSNEEAVGMVKSALGRYANRSAMDVTNQVVSSLPDDTVQDAEKSIEAQWYSHGVQDKLKQEADNMGISYDDYVGLFLKPAMVQSLVNKYGPNYRDIAEGIATRLYSHDEHVQDRLMNQDINDAFSSVINKYVNPSVVDEYNKAQEAGSKAFTEGMEGSQFIPANLRLGTALGAQYEANEAKDPAKVLSGLQKKFGKLYRNPEFLNDMSNAAYKVMQRYGLNGTLGSDPKQFKPMINSVLKNELDQLEIKGMMPKGSAEYIMKTGLGNTIVGKITRKAVQTDYQNWLEDMANQQYQPGFWENVASGALTFAGDAWSYWLPGAAGGKLTKSMLAKAEGKLAGDLMAKGMESRMAARAAKLLIGKSKTEALKSGAVHGAVTFGGQSVISKPIDEKYRTGQFDENGKIYNPSGWKIALDTLLEGGKQSALGVIMQGNTIANMIGKGRGLATNILADIGGKVADSGIMTGHQILERMAQDPNFKPTGKDAAESFLESMANLTAIGLPGMVGKYARFKDAREFNKKFDFTDQDIAELKRFGYDGLRDAFEKVGIGEYAVAGENAQRLDGQLTQKYMNLMNDKSVPEVLKAKMMAVVEGKRPSSFSPVVDSIIVQPMDHDGKVYLETLNKDGGIIDRKEYSSLDEAQKADKKLEYEKTLGLASVLEGEFHKEFTQEHLDGLYNKAAQKYNMGEKLTDEDKAAVYLHQNAGAIKEIMDKQQKGIVLTEEEQKQVNAYRHYYDSALENSSVMREFVNTFEDSHGVARGTLRKALESKDKKYAPLVESYLKELYNSIELKREMKQTMDDLYNTAHGNEQKRIEGEKPVSPVEGAAEGSAGGQEPPVSEGPAPYQDRTNSVPTPSDAEFAANPASSAAGGAGNETKVASSEAKVANSDAFVMGQEAYKNGDSGTLQAIDYNSDLATGRLKRAFADSDNMFDLVTKAYNEGRDMEQFLAQRVSLLTSAQKEAISKYVEAMDAKKGAIDALQHADDSYGEALKQQLWPYQTEDGNIVPATLTSGSQVFLKKANEYGGGFVVVPDEQGQPTIKQVSDAEIKEVGTPVPLDEYIESSLDQQKEARAQQFIRQFDGSGLKPNDRVTVAMEEGDENIDMTFAGYSEDGKIVLTDGKDNIALTREEFDTWRTNALNNTINENLDREDGERELAEIKRAEAEKQERYKKGIFGYAAGQPDYSDAQTDPKVAAEYLQETAGDDRKALFANIVAEKQALQKRINQLREHIASNEEWLSINADLDPKNAETRTLANKQMEGQIADLQARFDNWNKIRSAVMTPEEAQAIKADRTQKIADAGVNEGDVAPIEGREVAVLSDEELKKQYPTMDEASDFIASERKRIYRIQSDEVQREIDGVDEVLDRFVNGEIDLEPEQIKELNTTKAQLQARQANLTESAKELKAQADKLNTLYRKENMEARAKVVENLTPAEQRAIKVENAIKNGNMSQLNAIYDEVRGAIDFNDTEPNTLEEYVANSIGRFTLNYEGKDKGGAFSNGIQQETGLGRKDFDKLQILAKEGEGKTVPEFVHGLYDDMPENLKQMGYTDQDIRSAFLELIGSAQSYLDIKNYTLNNKVANVEQQMREVERQEEMMQDGAHSEAFDKIVELAKEQKEYWDLMEQGEVDPDDVPEVDVAHDMDELLKTLSDEEFKEVSDVLENLDEEFEYWTANEYERREGVGERKKKAENANIYDESIKETLKPVTPVAIALKSAVESGDKKAIKQAQKELTDALIASDLGLDYLSGQLAQAKLAKKKDELYKVKRATVKPLTDAIHAIESAKNIEDAPFADRLKNAIAETETEPTEAQKKAGNYKKGHLTFGGYDFTVETPMGVTRSGKDEQGKPWSVTMHDTYGYILGKIGVDGDHIDMFINDAADLDTFDGNVYVVDQINPETGEFDEHKVMYGYPDEAAATKAYLSNYSKGWKGLGKVTSVPKATFDKWLESSDRKTKPFREYAMIQHEEAKKAKQANEALPFDAPMNMDNLPFHRDVKEVKPSDMTEAQKVAYDAVSSMLKKAGIPVKVVSNEDMEKVAEAQDNLNLAMLLNQPEMRFKIKTPEEKQAAENAYNFAKELRPDKWKQYAVVDMSNPNKMPEYFEKQELARKERSYYNKLMWGNYKVFNLDKSFEDNVAGLTGSFPSEFDPYKIDAQTSKKNELKKQIKETEEAYKLIGQERKEYQNQLMKEYMDEHGLASENDIPDDVWREFDYKAIEKYQDKLDSLFAKYKDLDRQLKAVAEPGVRFLRTYHGTGASFSEFDFDHMGEGEGSQAFGWGGYVTSSKKIGKNYATLMDNDPSRAYYRIQHSNGTRFAKKYPTLESFLHGDKQIAMNDKFTEQEKIDYYNEMKKLAEPYHNLYEVDIPDDNGSNYLDWDAPLTDKQKNTIIKELRRLKIDFADFKKRGFSFDGSFGGNSYDFLMYALRKTKKWKDVNASRAVSKFLSSLGYTGIKYKAGRNFGGAEEGDTNYVIFKPEDMKIVDHTKFAQNKGVVYGYTDGKEIVLNQEHLNPNTPIHEYQHLWRTAAKEMNPELIAYGDELIKQTQLFADLKEDPNYKHLSDDEICDEAFARLTGEDGAAILEQMAKDAIKENPLDTAKELTIINRLKNWLKKFWYWTLDTFTKWKPEDIKKMTLEDIRNLVLRDLAQGVDPRNVKSRMTKEDAVSLRKQMADNAEQERILEHTEENWLKEFGKDSRVTTPIGSIKLGENQYKKAGRNDRIKRFGLLKPTLERPDVILEKSAPKEGAERQTKYLFIKSFKKADGNKILNYESITVKQGEDEVAISAHQIEPSKVVKELTESRVLWNRFRGDSNSLGENQGSALTPSANYPSGKDSVLNPHSDAKIRNSFEITKENGGNLSVEDKIKAVSQQFGVDEADVAMYANAVKKGSTAEAARARANIKRYLLQANEDKISSFKDIIKYTKPVNEALKENFGDLDAMIEERKKQVEAQRNAMEAARKRAEEEEAKRQKHLEELSVIPDDQLDKQYMDALAKGDDATAREMLDEAARRKGYDDTESSYQGVGAWAAPGNPGYESDKARRDDWESSGSDVNLEDMAMGYTPQPDDYFSHPERYSQNTPHGLESVKAINTAIDAIKNGEKDVKVKVYRAVPTSVKEGKLRNGDWVTPSRKYADIHGNNRLEGKYRIIEDEVPATQLWWDGNDANEFGFDDGKAYKYKNAKNNRKLNDLVTYDDKGDVIPPSKRFNSRKSDIRFMFAGEKGAAEADKAEEKTYRMDNLKVAEKMERGKKDAKAIKLATGWERGADGRWRYEMPDFKADKPITVDVDIDISHVGPYSPYKEPLCKLSDLIDDKNLFAAYPSLKNIDILLVGNTAFEGMYDKLHNNIALRTNAVSIDSKYSQPSNAKEIKAALEKFHNFWDSLTGEDKELADDAIDAYGGYTEEELKEDSYFRELEKENPKVAELVRLGNSIPSKKDVRFEGTQVALNHEGKSALAHEIQHAIQDIEGFAEGGNPEQFQDPSELESQYATFDELVKDKFGNNDAGTVIGIINGSTSEYQQFRSEFGKSWDEYFKNLKGMLGMMNGDEKLFKENYDYYVNEGRKKSAFEQYQSLAGEVEARNVMKRMWMTPEERRNSLAEETEDVNRDEQIVMNGNDASYSIVKDPETIKKLDKEDTVKVYRAMQVGEDGKLYPPMAAKVKGKFVEPIELGKWEQADERPELADDKGMFTLNKGNGKSLKAAYNPYLHTSRTPLNDQFSEAQNRPNIVTVEVEVPKSELTSGYKADKAKDAVGEVEWKAGIIQGQLTGKRKVVLSRWDKPVRIVPDSEVADVIVNDMFKGKNITMPSNVVTPSLRKELEKRGVPFVETDNRGRIVGGENDGVHYSKVYGKNAQSPILEQKLKKHPDSLMKAGTYFSGGGLVEEGLKGIIDPVVAVEYDRKISGVYRNNFGQHIVTADVRDVDPKELVKQIDGEVEYFHASPVCKNYSQAKTNGGEVELDKETAKSTADFIDAVKPRVVTIENVKGYKDSEAMKIITQALDKNGYTWDADVYNAADFGGYTNRERLIVRAVKDGELPEKPKKQPRKSGWLEAVEDILPTLKVKESGVAPWMDARLKADGIDWQKVEKPLYVMGSAYADGKIPHAYGDEILPTLRTKSGDVIIMPGGKVLRADGRVLARITGLGDDYLLPKTESLAHTIIGNGIPVQLTQGVIAPLLNKDDLSGRNVLARLGKSIFKNDWDADKQKKVSDQVVNTANKLGGAEATVYTSVDEVPDAYLSDVMNGATGWYDPTTHTVHVYLPNCADANEAERTVLHEKIGHEGMEVLLGGEDEVRKFANFVYNSVAASTRGKILEIANEYDPDWKKHDRMNVGTQEYIARLAEEGPKTAEDFSLWTKIKHYLIKVLKKLGIRVPGLLNDKDLRYYLMKAGKALHVWDDMPEAQKEAMMKQASNAEIKDSLGEGAGKGKPRQKKGESMIQYMKRVQEWRKWKDAREDENDPEPPMFYDIDKDEAGKKEWEQLNKEWRDRHHLAGEEPTGMPIRMKGETDDAYMTRIHDYEKWKDAMKDEEDPIPDMFDFEKSKQEEVKRKYEDWLARHELLEQQQADLDLYEGKIYPAETNPKADDLEQQVMQDLAEVTSTDVSKEGAAKTVKHAVIHRRKNMEEASADDAIYINDVKNRIEKMADSGVFDKLLSDYKGKKNRAEKLAETIPYIIEAPRRLRDMTHNLNATGVFDKGHIHIQPADVEAIQPYVTDLIVETAKKHTEIKKGKEIEVYDDPKAVSEVASKMAQAINANHQGEEGFVPCDGTDILSKHVLKLVKERVVPGRINYKELSPEMQAAIDSIRDWYNYTYDWLMDNHTLKAGTGYNVDYVNHIWDKEKSDPEAYATFVENRQRTKSPNEKPRTISTLMEGIYAGLVPKTTDITKMMAYYSRSNIEAWANKTMLQELTGLNVIERNEKGEVISTDPLLSSSAPFNLEQYKYFEIPGVGPVWVYNVSPKQVKVKNPITDNEKVLYSEASAGDRFGVVFDTYQSSPFWKAFDTLASSAKKLELGFSGFHAGALTEVYMVQNMVEFGPKKAMANFMKYIFADTAKNHELPCFANPQDFQEAASHLVKFGATNDYAAADVQNMFDNLRDAMMKVQEKLKDGNKISGTVAKASMPLKVATQMLSLINKGMDVALWDFLHDGLKLATYRMRADKTKERAKKKGWTEEELSRALDEDGQFVNDMFGGQHWDVLGASHRTLRYAGRVLLSPDWNASTTRHFLALTGYGSIWNEATFENFKQYYQRLWNKELTPEDEGRRGRQISALLCYGIGFMVFYEAFANGINAAFRAMDEEKERKKAEEMRKTNPDYKSMYELAYGDEGMKWYDYLMRGNSLGQQSKIFLGRYADGTEMYIRHGKQFREVPEYLFNHKGELEFPGPMVQRMLGKANPMVRMTLDDINYLSDFQASHADQEIQRKYGKTIGLLYKDALYWAPFLIPSQENKEFKAVDFFFPSSKGFSPWKAQSYFKDFILSGDMEGVVMTYQSCKRNGIDAEAQIKAAIGSVKALESAEMKDGVTSLQVACQRFDAAKSITEKKKMRQKMKKFLSMSDYKAFTQKEALDMVQGYLNGEEDLKEMEKADSKYLMAAKAEDVTEDWRIQNAWNGTMEAYQEYQRLKDIDKAKANAFKNSKTNKRLFAARKAISAAKRKMNKAKKQMDGTNGAAKMVEIRKTRKELLEKLNGME